MNPRLQKSRLSYLASPEPGGKEAAWIETPLGDAWVAACRVILRDGRPLIAELRIVPAEAPVGGMSHNPGEWSGTTKADAAVPGHGITFKLLKEFKPSMVFDHIAELRAAAERFSVDYWKSRGVEVPPLTKAKDPRGRKPSRPPRFYAEVARDYVAALESGSKQPSADLAKNRGISRSLARALVNRAREDYQFLEPAVHGKSGGKLTQAARAALRKTSNTIGAKKR